MATYTDKLVVLTEGRLQKVSSADTLEFSGTLDLTGSVTLASLEVTGDASVGGNLTVQGDIVSKGQTNVLIEDAFLDLAFGNTSATASAGGLTVNLKKATGFTALTADDFTAGGASGPEVSLSSVTGLSAGDIIQISGATKATNNGLFIVDSISGTDVTIYGVGGTAVPSYATFCQNQFEADTGNTASVVKVDLAVFAFSDGTLEGAEGMFALGTPCYVFAAGANLSTFDDGWMEFGGSVSLQNAYDAGASATITLTGSRDLEVNKPTSGTAAISLEANAASDFTVDAATLTLRTTTSGGLFLESAGSADLQAAGLLTIDSSGGVISIGSDSDAHNINVGTGAAARTITLGNITGATAVDVNTGTGGFTVDTQSGGPVSLDAFGANGNFTVTDGSLELMTVDGAGAIAGNVTITGQEDVVITATDGGVSVTADQEIALSAAAASSFGVSGGNLSLTTSTSGDLFISAADNLDLDSLAAFTLDADSFSIDGVALSNITVTGGNLNINTATEGDLGLTAADDLTLDALNGDLYVNAASGSLNIGDDANAGDINIGTAGARTITIGNAVATLVYDAASFDITATGAITLDAGANSHFTVAAADLVLSTTTSGTLELTSAATLDANAVDMDLDASGAFTLDADSFSIDAINPSNVTVTGDNLTLSTVTSGNVVVDSAAAIDMDAAGNFTLDTGGSFSIDGVGNSNMITDGGTLTIRADGTGNNLVLAAGFGGLSGNLTLTAPGDVLANTTGGDIILGNNVASGNITVGTGAAARTITVGNATGATALDFNAGTGGVTVDTTSGGAISLDAIGAASNFSVTSGNLSLQTLTSGTLDVTSAGAMDIDAASALQINSSGAAIQIGNDAVAHAIDIGTGAAARTITVGNATGATTLDVNLGTGGMTVDTTSGGAISLDAVGAASNFSVTSGNLSLKTLTSGTLDVTSAGVLDIDAASTLSINASGSAGINIGNDSATGTINIGIDGNRFLNIGSLTAPVVFGFANLGGAAAGAIYLPSSNVAKGSVVYVAPTTGKATEADCDAAGKKEVVGVTLEQVPDGNIGRVATVAGTQAYTRFKTGDAPSAASDIGSPVYLSDSAGEAGMTPPTAGRVYRLGILLSNTADSGLYPILWQPQFVADL